MKKIKALFFMVYCMNISCSPEMILEQYKVFLEQGTYENADWSLLPKIPASRYATFKYAFEHFVNTKGKIVVELGTTRSFVHGGLEGCNSNDIRYWTPHSPERWDWGAGSFTRVAAECLAPYVTEFHTVDLAAEHIFRCKIITAPFKHFISYHICSSEDFLAQWPLDKKIDLLYLDTGDMTPLEPTAQLHLREARYIVERDLLADQGIIIIDDVRNQTPKKFGETSEYGKAKYSLPYFLNHGFELVMDEYQVIVRKIRG